MHLPYHCYLTNLLAESTWKSEGIKDPFSSELTIEKKEGYCSHGDQTLGLGVMEEPG